MTSMQFGYCRTSTRQQDLGLQRDALIKAGVEAENLFEEQESGAKKDRPVLKDVLSRLRKGDTFVCWKFDRIARSASHLLAIVEDLKARGVNFISLTEGVDLATPMGKFMLTVLGGFAEMERSMIEERREAGLQRAREAGKRFGRKSAADPTAKTDKSGRLAKAMLAVAGGQSLRSAAKEHRIGAATLSRHLSAQKDISERTSGAFKSERISEQKPARNGHINGSSGLRAELR
jgi:serine recombinase